MLSPRFSGALLQESVQQASAAVASVRRTARFRVLPLGLGVVADRLQNVKDREVEGRAVARHTGAKFEVPRGRGLPGPLVLAKFRRFRTISWPLTLGAGEPSWKRILM